MNQSLMRYRGRLAVLGGLGLLLAAIVAGCGQETKRQTAAKDSAIDAKMPFGSDADDAQPAAETDADKAVEVTSCDGENKVAVDKDLAGAELAQALLAQWKRDHPGRDWVADEKAAHAFNPPADNADVLQGGQSKGDVYGNFTQRDLVTWSRETEKFVAEGSRIFHGGDALGSTVGVSCDMCHPHASNTHPETYPKFQVQLGRVALLRDMIEWCIENPVRGTHLDPDGPTMRALEAYIMAQRKGAAMNYGKH
ncbi:MAG: hypothetical protein NTW96_07420 [Planctomycetia bacterium]|nr:hypothetical protein [Planctomycetia bacterium]